MPEPGDVVFVRTRYLGERNGEHLLQQVTSTGEDIPNTAVVWVVTDSIVTAQQVREIVMRKRSRA